MIDEHLYSFLSNNTTITDVCPRIYSVDAPADVALPLVTYQELSNYRTRSWDGTNPQIQSSVVISAWATTKAEAASVANVLLDELEDYVGAMGTKTVQQIDLDNAVLSYDPDTKEYGAGIDCTIYYY